MDDGRRGIDLTTLKDTPSWEWPEETAATLLDILRGDRSSASDLLLAAELAGDVTVIASSGGRAALDPAPRRQTGGRTRPGGDLWDRCSSWQIPRVRRPPDYGADVPGDPGTPRALHGRQRPPERAAADPGGLSACPRNWHRDAIRAAYGSGDETWRLTAVFCMRFIPGFEEQILEALASPNPDLHYEAVVAAGNWGLDAAWPHVAALVASRKTPKLLAIDAAASIRPHDALELLGDLADSDDEDIADAVHEALAMAQEHSVDDEGRGSRRRTRR